jgi:hypothetical protein
MSGPVSPINFQSGGPDRPVRIDKYGRLEAFQETIGSSGVVLNGIALQGNTTQTATATGAHAITIGHNGLTPANFAISIGVGTNTLGTNAATDSVVIGRASAAAANSVFVNQSQSFSGLSSQSVVIGFGSLNKATAGATNNVVIGQNAAPQATTARQCVIIGQAAVGQNTTGNNLVVLGHQALLTSAGTTASYSNIVAIGFQALDFHTVGSNNVGVGTQTLFGVAFGTITPNNVTQNSNTAVGYQSLSTSLTLSQNTCAGIQAGFCCGSGASNVAIGFHTLYNQYVAGGLTLARLQASTWAQNVAVGVQCLLIPASNPPTMTLNTAVGYLAGNNVIFSATGNTLLGFTTNVNSNSITYATIIGANNNTWNNSNSCVFAKSTSIFFVVCAKGGISASYTQQAGFYSSQPANTKNPAGTPYQMLVGDISPDVLTVATSVTGGGETWTTPTGAALSAACAVTSTGNCFYFALRNEGAATITVAANASGITLGSGLYTVAASTCVQFKVTCTGANTWTVQRVMTLTA